MKKKPGILVYGAGAIGSIFAGKLAEAGYDVTVLARGKRLEEINGNGIVLIHAVTGKKTAVRVKTVGVLEPGDRYDYVIVAVQNTQIDGILPVLKKNVSGNIVFTVNNPLGYREWIDAVGKDRLMAGFPSAGGERKNGAVYHYISRGFAKIFQATTFGEPDGRRTKRLLDLVKMFRKAGFSPSMNSRMEDWQKTHVAVILPIAKALYRFGSDNYRLARSPSDIREMILATRECFTALRRLNVKITPFKLNFYRLPLWFLVPAFMAVMNTKIAEFAMARHTVAGRDEILALERQFRSLIAGSGVNTPALDSFNA